VLQLGHHHRLEIETDQARTSEVEIAFTELTPQRTEVVLTHSHLDRHGERWQGMLQVVLPADDDSDLAGIGIFAASPEDTRTIMDDDPGVRAGLFTYRMHPVRGFPGAALH